MLNLVQLELDRAKIGQLRSSYIGSSPSFIRTG